MKAALNIMVCVTGQRSCDKLIAHGVERAEAAKGSEFNIHVVHCVETGHNFMNNPDEGDAIEYLFTAAQVAGGQLSLLRADDVDDALVNYAQQHDVALIIMGAAGSNRQGKKGDPITIRLQRRLPEIEFDVIATDNDEN